MPKALLEGVSFRRCDLDGANLEGARLAKALFKNASLREAFLAGADLREANLESADLEGANLQGANLVGANLNRANLEGANLQGADLAGARLTHAKLDSAKLGGANLVGAQLSHADLTDGDLSTAKLDEADLTNADLTDANLEEASLVRAKMRDARSAGRQPQERQPHRALDAPGLTRARGPRGLQALLRQGRRAAQRGAGVRLGRLGGDREPLRAVHHRPGRRAPSSSWARAGTLSGCQIRGAGKITIHGKFVERESPGITGATQLVVTSGGSLIGAVEQPPEHTRFAFEPGCMLRMKIQGRRRGWPGGTQPARAGGNDERSQDAGRGRHAVQGLALVGLSHRGQGSHRGRSARRRRSP